MRVDIMNNLSYINLIWVENLKIALGIKVYNQKKNSTVYNKKFSLLKINKQVQKKYGSLVFWVLQTLVDKELAYLQ